MTVPSAHHETRRHYRLLTGTDDGAFCERASRPLPDGYRPYGNPTNGLDGHQVIVAQAVVLDDTESETTR